MADNRAATSRLKPFPGFGYVFASICGSCDGGGPRNHLRLRGLRDCRGEIREEGEHGDNEDDENDTSSRSM